MLRTARFPWKAIPSSVGALLASFSTILHGFPIYFQQFQGHYEENQISVNKLAENESCGICHVSPRGGGQRNPYGKDFLSAVRDGQGFAGPEFLDSDQDTYNNLEEIWLNTAPGREDSTPVGRIEITRTSSAFNISAKSVCAQMEILGLGSNLQNGDQQSFSDVGDLSIPSGQGGGILVSCPTEGLVGSYFD